MAQLGHTALGTWSGGRFMHFGEPLDDERLAALLRPDERIRTVITADAYGAGEADTLLGRALSGVPRDSYALVGAIGWGPSTQDMRTSTGATKRAICALEPMAMFTARSILSL